MKYLEKKRIKLSIAIVFIAFFSFLVCWPLTQDGYARSAHDTIFHFSQINDLYLMVKSGQGFSKISSNLFHGIGYGTRLFYGPFSHAFTVVVGLIIEPFGLNLMAAYKIVIFLSVFVSGLMTFFFVKRVTKNQFYGIIAAIIYIVFPYRITDIYIRNAFAEVVSFAFLPGVFWGAYEIIHQRRKDFWHISKSYLLLAINFTLLFLTHNITALFCFIFVIFYFLINSYHVYQTIKNSKRNIIYGAITILVILAATSSSWVTLLEQQKGMKYLVFNKDVMWAKYELLSKEALRSKDFFIAGLNNFEANIFRLIACATSGVLTYLTVKTALKDKIKYKKSICLGASVFVLLMFPLLINWNNRTTYNPLINISFLIIAACIGLVFLDFNAKDNQNSKNLLQVLSFAVLVVINLALIYLDWTWKSLPDILYNIQFPWRLWVFFGLFFIVGALILVSYIKCNYLYKKIVLSFVAAFCVLSVYPINKGVTNEIIEINNIPYNDNAGGWQKEYFPNDFFKNENYYERSPLYRQIRETIDHPEPVALRPYSSNANIIFANEYIRAPQYHADITLEEDSIIQFPFIFYSGYKAVAKTTVNNKVVKSKLPILVTDFLVSVELKASTRTTYNLEIDFVGTSLMRFSNVCTFLGRITFVIVPAIPLGLKIKKKIDKRKANG